MYSPSSSAQGSETRTHARCRHKVVLVSWGFGGQHRDTHTHHPCFSTLFRSNNIVKQHRVERVLIIKKRKGVLVYKKVPTKKKVNIFTRASSTIEFPPPSVTFPFSVSHRLCRAHPRRRAAARSRRRRKPAPRSPTARPIDLEGAASARRSRRLECF